MVWKMAIFKASLTALIGGASTWVTSMAGLEWSELSGTNKAIVLIGATITMGNTTVAFLDRSIARIEQGMPPDVDSGQPKP